MVGGQEDEDAAAGAEGALDDELDDEPDEDEPGEDEPDDDELDGEALDSFFVPDAPRESVR
ncbi:MULTISPECIES: hypothetical protein [unclassified Microbacterium]|uniref:hypothetical protein n=1 Tax=unclassified Microbacterium TaxID=2609290 RepID=UPI0039C95CDA